MTGAPPRHRKKLACLGFDFRQRQVDRARICPSSNASFGSVDGKRDGSFEVALKSLLWLWSNPWFNGRHNMGQSPIFLRLA